MNTTPGEWIVVPAKEPCSDGTFLHQVMAVTPDGNKLVALVPNMADAALISAQTKLLDVVTHTIDTLNKSKEPINIEALNALASEAIEKIAAEAGEI
jgi:hypothetical protein